MCTLFMSVLLHLIIFSVIFLRVKQIILLRLIGLRKYALNENQNQNSFG
jgi:hypothetical protein